MILDDFSYIVLKNQRLGIIGPNGCGKSTLMKMIAGQVIPDSGNIEIGETIKIGYFAQEEQEMDPSTKSDRLCERYCRIYYDTRRKNQCVSVVGVVFCLLLICSMLR